MSDRRNRLLTLTALAVCGLGSLLLPGCGSKYPATVPVSGRVTWRGNPVEKATVTFSRGANDIALGEVAIGGTDADGRFEMTTHFAGQSSGQGALPGDYTVTISKPIPPPGVTAERYRVLVEAARKIGESGAPVPPAQEPPALVEMFPPHICAAEKSRLKFTVPTAGTAAADFALE